MLDDGKRIQYLTKPWIRSGQMRINAYIFQDEYDKLKLFANKHCSGNISEAIRRLIREREIK